MVERYYPREENLGKDCEYWNLDGSFQGCNFPNAKLHGRVSCEGVIDDICLFIKGGRAPGSLSDEEASKLSTRPINIVSNRTQIPPGGTTR